MRFIWLLLFAMPAFGQDYNVPFSPPVAAGAAEDLYCGGSSPASPVFSLTNMTGTCGNVDEDPDSPDGEWVTADADNVNVVLRASMDEPTLGDPTGTQTFRVWVRTSKTTGTGTPTLTIEVRETGDSAADASCNTGTVTSTSGEMKTCDWAASVLEDADGSEVEVYLSCPSAGGGPNERTCDFGAIEWVKN